MACSVAAGYARDEAVWPTSTRWYKAHTKAFVLARALRASQTGGGGAQGGGQRRLA